MERRVQLVTLRTANTGRYLLPGADQEIVVGDDSGLAESRVSSRIQEHILKTFSFHLFRLHNWHMNVL